MWNAFSWGADTLKVWMFYCNSFLKPNKKSSSQYIYIHIYCIWIANSFSPISPIQVFTLPYLFSCVDGAFPLWVGDYTPGLAYILAASAETGTATHHSRSRAAPGLPAWLVRGVLQVIQDQAPCSATPLVSTRSTRTEENDSELNSSYSKLAAVRSLTRHAAPLLLVLKWLESKLRQ